MKKPSKEKVPKKHGWEPGKPPFQGAAPPIHTQMGGKFVKKPKGDCP